MNGKTLTMAVLAVCFLFDLNVYADNQKANVLNDPTLFRHYRFGEVKDNRVKNLAGETGDLIFTDFAARKEEPFSEELRIVQGRLPGRKAVQLDQCSFLDIKYLNPESITFSFTCWVKIRGYGKVPPISTYGTIVSVGTGYYGGWRIFIGGPSMQVEFEIGSKNPPGGSYLKAGFLAPDVWQHVAAVWNGKQQQVYVNGKLAGEKTYPGNYVNEGRLVIGYSTAGVGSLNMEIDEAAIYSRALTAEEIARLFESQQ